MANNQITINNKGLDKMIFEKSASAFARGGDLLFIVYCLFRHDAIKVAPEVINKHKTVRA